jgi:Methyltransferase domain
MNPRFLASRLLFRLSAKLERRSPGYPAPRPLDDFTISDEELSFVVPILQRLLWADKETRAKIQGLGINVLPVNFYSNTPSIEEIETSYEYTSDAPPYLNAQIFEEGRLRQTLEKLLEFSTSFDPPDDGNEEDCREFFWNNSQFSFSNAMSYYCFVRLVKPASIVEIGSGFSTLVALKAIEDNGTGSIHCIEPFPRAFLKTDTRLSLHMMKAQDVQPDFLNDILRDGDILFIDSTHTVKSGSDCLHISSIAAGSPSEYHRARSRRVSAVWHA